MVVDAPAGTDYPGEFVGDELFGDTWGVNLAGSMCQQDDISNLWQTNSFTHVGDLDGAMSFLDTGSLGCMVSGSVLVQVLLGDALLLIAEGGESEDQLLLRSHCVLLQQEKCI